MSVQRLNAHQVHHSCFQCLEAVFYLWEGYAEQVSHEDARPRVAALLQTAKTLPDLIADDFFCHSAHSFVCPPMPEIIPLLGPGATVVATSAHAAVVRLTIDLLRIVGNAWGIEIEMVTGQPSQETDQTSDDVGLDGVLKQTDVNWGPDQWQTICAALHFRPPPDFRYLTEGMRAEVMTFRRSFAAPGGSQPAIKPLSSSGEQNSDARHSPDFASVVWFGHSFTFTGAQRAIVCELWGAWANGTPELSIGYLLDAAGVDDKKTARIPNLFRFDGHRHPAFGTMIVPGILKDTYRLQEPLPKKKSKSTQRQR